MKDRDSPITLEINRRHVVDRLLDLSNNLSTGRSDVTLGLHHHMPEQKRRTDKIFPRFSQCLLAGLIMIASTLAWSSEIRHIYSPKGKSTLAYFQDDEPGAIVWVYSTSGKGPIGYFQKGEANDITYIYRSNGQSPLYFTETISGPIYIYSVGKPGVWGYFNKR